MNTRVEKLMNPAVRSICSGTSIGDNYLIFLCKVTLFIDLLQKKSMNILMILYSSFANGHLVKVYKSYVMTP